MPLLFAVTLFVGATLTFGVQPMIAKTVLPLLGGTPAVWNTCLVFYQATLLAGYAYAHVTSAWLGVRRQTVLHCALLLLPFLVLPIRIHALDEALPFEVSPVLWILRLLLVSAALPLFMVSTSSSLAQKWFASTGHPSAKDPYFLYAASNLGSLLALLSYPLLIEPNLSLAEQNSLWAGGYGVYVLLTLVCAVIVWRIPSSNQGFKGQRVERGAPGRNALTWRRRFRWLALAFVPSSLMLGVTTYISTDLAAIPLLWVLPLSLYLLTFTLVFPSRRIVPHALMGRLLALGALLLTLLLLAEDMQPPVYVLAPLHLGTFFVAAMVCHGELAQDRPPVQSLTEFYLWLAIGGVLGGLFNALVAPLVFTRVIEYPLALVLACLFRPPIGSPAVTARSRRLDLGLPFGLGVLTAGLILGLQAYGMDPGRQSLGLMFGLPAVICYTFVGRPARFALGLGAMLLAGSFYTGLQGRTLYVYRSFFGVVRVTRDPTGNFIQLVHGNTVHGRQSLDPKRPHEPLAYYAPTGPIGQIFAAFKENASTAESHVAVLGLGAGSLAWYAEPGQDWTYYEIDPAIEGVAREFFAFLHEFRGRRLQVIPGDGRLRLREAPDHSYVLIVLDAFSSDAIPVHLLTRQAVQTYLDKLATRGVLAFHISNRYVDLKPILGKLAEDAGLVSFTREDLNVPPEEKRKGKDPSEWVVMARQVTGVGKLATSAGWYPLRGKPKEAVWTDDFSNLLKVFKWE